MKISKKSQYGLRAMAFLAKHDKKICSLRMIAEKEDISFNYLEKILFNLEKKGLIKSKKGVHGGYTLTRSPQKIKLGEIMNALDGELNLVECIGAKMICPKKKKCKAAGIWKKLQKSLEKTINSITMHNLIK